MKEKYLVINNTSHNIYLDIDGKENTDDIVVLGAKCKTNIELPEKRVSEIKQEFGANLILKKVK